MSRPSEERSAVSAARRFAMSAIAALALLAGLLTPSLASAAEPVAAASNPAAASPLADLSGPSVRTAVEGFDPGHIISDAVFFNTNTMSEGDIQTFLNARVPNCQSGYVCLKDKFDTSRNTSADPMCAAYTGAGRESAARIIYKVAQACGINPQVLLVTLQKEQGLVTHTWPSDWRYTIAMGQGCPDTAACDTAYYGFFNQVYGAARQFKRYANPPGTSNSFTWYAPGKTWNILYNPNHACGSAPVYIQNQATSNLYYYTPYQPNAAALRAGFGEGDSCSAYGNRNFHNYFTMWFGSTGGGSDASGLIVLENREVWLLSGDNRYHVTPEAYAEYLQAFGAPVSMSAGILSEYREGPKASVIVRNSETGTIALLEGGESHRFPHCNLLVSWSGSCGGPFVELTNAHFGLFSVGEEVTEFTRIDAAGRIHKIENDTLTPLFDDSTVKSLNNGIMPFAGVMPAEALAAYTIRGLQFPEATFIRVEGKPEVWLPTPDGGLYHLTSWNTATDIGLPSNVGAVVSEKDISGYTFKGSLGIFIECRGVSYKADSGILYKVSDGSASDSAIPVGDATCEVLTLTESGSPTPTTRQGLVRATSGAVWLLSGAVRFHVTPEAFPQYVSALGTPSEVTDAVLSAYSEGPRADTVVRNVKTGVIALLEAGSTRRLPTCDLVEWAGSTCAGPHVSLTEAIFEKFQVGAEISLTTRQGLARIASGEVWLLSDTYRYHVTAEAFEQYRSALGSPVAIDDSVLSAYSTGPRSDFILRNQQNGTIALLEEGATRRFIDCESMNARGATCTGPFVNVTSKLFEMFPVGAEISAFDRQGLVRLPSGEVWLLSGTSRYHVTADGFPQYLAVLGPFSAVTESAIVHYTEGPRADVIVRSAETREIARLQSSETNRFTDCETLSQTTSGVHTCAGPFVELSDSHYRAFSVGPEIAAL